MRENALIDYAENYGIMITPKQSKLLIKDMELVLKFNQKLNLTAITDEEAFIDKHLIDSLLCPIDTRKPPLEIIDVGTGGGFPGIPLAIQYPMHHFTLLDSTEKKLRAVEKITDELELKNVSFLEGRAEVLAHDPKYREKYDAVVSRGVAAYTILLELCTPFLKVGGVFFAWKGQHYNDELETAENALRILKMTVTNIKRELLMKSESFHVIIGSEKNSSITDKYPRNFGAIKKKPL